ncbi:hypothetical protein C8J55DRAFT_491731 [Lentinula edodes]|uniref:Uncharacterized protein n=1 Tax=Lentinula lateritia TaxID=40482 RepID=A0A9W8ZZ21_9AGAR|nr:hypothetical protein C8J55DRAFT_491731 [Lentinula edodes]
MFHHITSGADAPNAVVEALGLANLAQRDQVLYAELLRERAMRPMSDAPGSYNTEKANGRKGKPFNPAHVRRKNGTWKPNLNAPSPSSSSTSSSRSHTPAANLPQVTTTQSDTSNLDPASQAGTLHSGPQIVSAPQASSSDMTLAITDDFLKSLSIPYENSAPLTAPTPVNFDILFEAPPIEADSLPGPSNSVKNTNEGDVAMN